MADVFVIALFMGAPLALFIVPMILSHREDMAKIKARINPDSE